MAVCDELEATLQAAQKGAVALVGAVVGEFQGAEKSGTVARSGKADVQSESLPSKPRDAVDEQRPPQPSTGGGTDVGGGSTVAFLDMDPDTQAEAVFDSLWCKGPVPSDEAVRMVAEDLRERGLVEFKRLRKDGPLAQAITKGIQRAVRYGYLDRPSRGFVRAVCLDAKDYTPEDWWIILEKAIGGRSFESEDDAVRQAAEWARENCGLAFARFRRGGLVHKQLAAVHRLLSNARPR